MNKYTIQFDFTTVKKSGLFTGRSGEVDIEAECDQEQVQKDEEVLQRLCAQAIYNHNPKWVVFMISITKIIKQE
jgi:hypothetical protein